jgi:FkbM family methyltransferase
MLYCVNSMDIHKREELKKKILKRYELYKLQGSRFKRFLKDPVRTLAYYIMQSAGYIHPYKVHYKTLWGDSMTFYLPEGGAIYYYGFFEANLSNFLINFLQEGDVVLDVGAHVGYYTMLASSLVGSSGKVYSFEPTPRTFISLEENASKKSNIVVNNNAVFDEEKEIEFFDYGPKYSAFNSFKPRTSDDIYFKDKANRILVKTVSLDRYCTTHNITPTIIKIDAEGSENVILATMHDLLGNKHPMVTIEVAGGEEWRDNCAKSISTLLSYGYDPYEITLDGHIREHVVQDEYSYDNLLFIHPSTLPNLQKWIQSSHASRT